MDEKRVPANSRFKITKRISSNDSKDETAPLFVSSPPSSGIGSLSPTQSSNIAKSILEGKNVAFSPYNTIHDGTDGMGSEFRKVISKCVNEAKVGRKSNAPVVSKAYLESMDRGDISLTTMSLLNKTKPGGENDLK